ncbi:hypothetical protein [Chromobacterium amazonense]|uniref:hypothetical protein n=1 Tax=Chromobacterium amazonense TaxID=1382803 RepID=UPI003B968242
MLDDGRKVTVELFRELQAREVAKLQAEYGARWTRQYEDAARMFDLLTTSDDFVEFLTLPGYEYIA